MPERLPILFVLGICACGDDEAFPPSDAPGHLTSDAPGEDHPTQDGPVVTDAPPYDAFADGLFTCITPAGTQTCSDGEYCHQGCVPIVVRARNDSCPEAGATPPPGCNPIPSHCEPMPTCDCIQVDVGCACYVRDGHPYVQCFYGGP